MSDILHVASGIHHFVHGIRENIDSVRDAGQLVAQKGVNTFAVEKKMRENADDEKLALVGAVKVSSLQEGAGKVSCLQEKTTS